LLNNFLQSVSFLLGHYTTIINMAWAMKFPNNKIIIIIIIIIITVVSNKYLT